MNYPTCLTKPRLALLAVVAGLLLVAAPTPAEPRKSEQDGLVAQLVCEILKRGPSKSKLSPYPARPWHYELSHVPDETSSRPAGGRGRAAARGRPHPGRAQEVRTGRPGRPAR